MDQSVSVYLHIPFCIKKCNYCDFCSFPIDKFLVEKYINCLTKEITEAIDTYTIKNVKTIYLGGGTPSLLSINQLEKIIRPLLKLKFEENYEFTIEVNPKTGNKNYFRDLKSIGINRLSVGVQTLKPELLKLLGRVHNVNDIYKTLDNIQQSGIENLSIDLMYGLPTQTLEDWENTLNHITQLDVQHISTYGLKIEENTIFNNLYKDNYTVLPNEELTAKMFLLTHDILESNGYKHYEISNYAKLNKESIHNINYWNNNDYYGFGLSACSYINRHRIENSFDLDSYIDDHKKNRKINMVTNTEFEEDAIYLGLRLFQGLNLQEFENKFKVKFLEKYRKIILKYSQYFYVTKDYISLNKEGMLLSNNILSEFIDF